jgi:hypothetical protein
MPIPLLIHIGYHKTGTSFLQKYLFDAEMIGFCSPFDRQFIMEHLIQPHPFQYNPERTRYMFLPGLEQVRRQAYLVPVLSRERFTGSQHSNGRDGILMAQRLAASFPEAQILMVIREQRSMLLSSYNQHICSGRVHTLVRYLKEPAIYKDYIDLAEFDLTRYVYHYLIQTYYDLFGREKVLVLPYELFRAQPQVFVTEIVRFCDLPVQSEAIAALPYSQRVNVAFSPISLWLKRHLNYLTTAPNPMNGGGLFPSKRNNDRINRGLRYLDRYLPESLTNNTKAQMQALIQRTIGDRYAESNAQTQRLTGLDLKQYGYQLSLTKGIGDAT